MLGGAESGRVKVLDFGLAKLTTPGPDSDTAMPTALATGEGRILGTVAYMSPEQAEGKAIDARSDLFSLGVMLYEMATGQRPFAGDTSVSIISAIIKDTPAPVTDVNPALPRELGRIVRRALAKDPERRYQTAKDLRNDLADLKTSLESGEFLPPAVGSLPPVVHRRGTRAVPWIVATASCIGLLAVAFVHFTARPAPRTLVKSSLVPPIQLLESNSFSLSPDGRYLAIPGAGPDGVVKIWILSLDGRDPRPVSGTETVSIAPPFWSPDSAFIAYDQVGQLMKVSISGGAPQPVCRHPGLAVGGTWNDHDVIVVGTTTGGLMRCLAAGGAAAEPITSGSPTSSDEISLFPSFLPGGQRFLYLRISRAAPEKSGLFVGSLADDPAVERRERLLQTGFSAAYVPGRNSVPAQILFMLEGVLYTQRFDDRQLVLMGDRQPVAPQVGSFLDFALFAVSTTGVLVSRAPDPESQLTWFDRTGYRTTKVGAPGPYTQLAMSPDGTRALVVKHDSRTMADQDLWEINLGGTVPPRKRTIGPNLEANPVWMPDNDHVIYQMGAGAESVYEMPADGSEPARPLQTKYAAPNSVSHDGLFLLSTKPGGPTGSDLWAYSLGREPAEDYVFLTDQRDQEQGQLSPDGVWVAYVSNENGPRDVFVAPIVHDPATGFIRAGHGVPVSKNGGTSPRWSGRNELFYLATDGTVMFSARTGRGFGPGAATEVRVPGVLRDWGVSPDGTRFLLAVPVHPPALFDLRMNWDAGLTR